MIKGFVRCDRGNIAVIAALCALPILMACAYTIDHTAMVNERYSLQSAADAGALAGAGRLSMGGNEFVTSAAVATARAHLDHVKSPVTLKVEIAEGAVTVTARADHTPIIGFLADKTTPISVRATAEGLLKTPLCILQTGDTEMKLDDQATIRARGCLVHGNRDITVASGAMLQASLIQATGKTKGPMSPVGNNGAIAISDPFAGMDLVAPTDCAAKLPKSVVVAGSVLSLPAGVHCDEYKLEKDATLVLQPGEHWFLNKIETKENAVLRGDDVVMIFSDDSSVKFNDRSSVQVTARKSGLFAGFLIVTSRNNDEKFVIASDNVSELLGTIYIPNSELEVETAGQVAEDSAWSIIVAKTITLKRDPVLVINTRYAGSGVPVPQGVGPSASAPRLTR